MVLSTAIAALQHTRPGSENIGSLIRDDRAGASTGVMPWPALPGERCPSVTRL